MRRIFFFSTKLDNFLFNFEFAKMRGFSRDGKIAWFEKLTLVFSRRIRDSYEFLVPFNNCNLNSRETSHFCRDFELDRKESRRKITRSTVTSSKLFHALLRSRDALTFSARVKTEVLSLACLIFFFFYYPLDALRRVYLTVIFYYGHTFGQNRKKGI